jgi:hypothetical protein
MSFTCQVSQQYSLRNSRELDVWAIESSSWVYAVWKNIVGCNYLHLVSSTMLNCMTAHDQEHLHGREYLLKICAVNFDI